MDGPACCGFVWWMDGARLSVSLFLLALAAISSTPSTVSIPRLFRVRCGVRAVVVDVLVKGPELGAFCENKSKSSRARDEHIYRPDTGCGIQLTLIAGGWVTDSSVSSSSTISITSLEELTGSTFFKIGGKAFRIAGIDQEKKHKSMRARYLDHR